MKKIRNFIKLFLMIILKYVYKIKLYLIKINIDNLRNLYFRDLIKRILSWKMIGCC